MGTMGSTVLKPCKDKSAKCFARTNTGFCQILISCSKKCAFKKAEREYTHGKRYPYNPQSSYEREFRSPGNPDVGGVRKSGLVS